MFRLLSLIAILLTLGWLGVGLKSRSVTMAATGNLLKEAGANIVSSLAGLKSISSKNFGQKLVLPVILLSVILLALTGFVPPVFFGFRMSGYLLMLHVVIGPLFILFITLGAIIWSQQNLFTGQDWNEIKDIFTGKEPSSSRNDFYKKILYWIMIFLSLIAVSSIFLSMYKIFGTYGQEFLLNLHRYSTLVLFIDITIYWYILKFGQDENEAEC